MRKPDRGRPPTKGNFAMRRKSMFRAVLAAGAMLPFSLHAETDSDRAAGRIDRLGRELQSVQHHDAPAVGARTSCTSRWSIFNVLQGGEPNYRLAESYRLLRRSEERDVQAPRRASNGPTASRSPPTTSKFTFDMHQGAQGARPAGDLGPDRGRRGGRRSYRHASTTRTSNTGLIYKLVAGLRRARAHLGDGRGPGHLHQSRSRSAPGR